MQTPIIGDVISSVVQLAGDLVTTDKERLQLDIDGYNAESKRMESQAEINKVEASNTSLFVSGWRPAVGWCGVAAMSYQFVVYPFLVWGWNAMQAAGWISTGLLPPPMLDTDALWVILTGILGIGTMRSTEKIKGKA